LHLVLSDQTINNFIIPSKLTISPYYSQTPLPHPWGAEEKRKSEGKVRTIKSYNENVTRINDTQGVNPMFVIATMQSVS